jgi:preprotein translocase subunit SecE
MRISHKKLWKIFWIILSVVAVLGLIIGSILPFVGFF